MFVFAFILFVYIVYVVLKRQLTEILQMTTTCFFVVTQYADKMLSWNSAVSFVNLFLPLVNS